MRASTFNDLVGSWTFIRSTDPHFDPRQIYHFTADGFNYWEVDKFDDHGRHLSKLQYNYSEGALTLIYPAGNRRQFQLSQESDGSIKFPGMNGHVWWMTRLKEPTSYLRAFVDSTGYLSELGSYFQK